MLQLIQWKNLQDSGQENNIMIQVLRKINVKQSCASGRQTWGYVKQHAQLDDHYRRMISIQTSRWEERVRGNFENQLIFPIHFNIAFHSLHFIVTEHFFLLFMLFQSYELSLTMGPTPFIVNVYNTALIKCDFQTLPTISCSPDLSFCLPSVPYGNLHGLVS